MIDQGPRTADHATPPEPDPRIQDVVVAGAGVAGLALALAIKRAHPAAAVTLCDPKPPGEAARSFRAVAVAAGSRRFLDGLGVWDAVAPRAQPIESMVITDSRPGDAPRPAYLDFGGEVEAETAFAHMALHDDLRAVLVQACDALAIPRQPLGVTGFASGPNALVLATTGGARLRTRLLVAADGSRSRLREAAGIGTVGWAYDQAGIVATISHDRPHEGRATQHFLPGGPLAILPLRAEDGSDRRFSLVWTERLSEARRLAALPPAAFLAALEDVVGFEYGSLTLDDRPTAHDLRLTLPRRLVGERFCLLGDAARTIHPLAGQGLNLGLRDAAVLAELVGTRLSLGLDPGGPDTLDAYQRARRFDSLMMAAATDGLNRLFSNDSGVLRVLRDIGLGLVDRLPGLKRAFMRDAAGLTGALPRGFEAAPRMREAERDRILRG